MPKVDPETQKLYDEINGLIQKFQVNRIKKTPRIKKKSQKFLRKSSESVESLY